MKKIILLYSINFLIIFCQDNTLNNNEIIDNVRIGLVEKENNLEYF